VVSAVQSFVDSYNKVVDTIATDTAFNADDQTKNGVLFGDATVQQLQDAMGLFVTRNYSGVGAYTNLAGVGITIGQDGKLELDTDKLNTALAENPDDVRTLFTTNTKAVAADLTTNPPTQAKPAVQGIGAALNDFLARFTDAGTGTLFTAADSLTAQETQMKKHQTDLASLLLQKKNRLIQSFANLESTIAGIKNQGTAISSLQKTTSS
jgi:flagellar hook-associated protein 2